MRFLKFLQRGGRCGNTTVPVVALGAHGCRRVTALVYAHASSLALAHAIGLSRAPPSTFTAVADGVGWYGASTGIRGAGLMTTCVVAGGVRVRSRGAHPRRSRRRGMMSGLISAATGLHSSSPPRRSSTATHSRGTTFAAAVQQHRPRRRAAFLSPRRSSAVMFPCGYPCRELMSVAATGLRSPSPPNIRSDMSRPSALGTDRRGRLSVSSAVAGDAAPSTSLVRGDAPPSFYAGR